MLLLLAALAAAQPLPVGDTEPEEGHCDHIARDGRPGELPPPGLHVIEATRGTDSFSPAAIPAGASIRCQRGVIVPAANDWKVLAAGHPFYLVEMTEVQEPRIGALEISQGQVRYRMLRGRMTPDEGDRITARLNEFQLHFQR